MHICKALWIFILVIGLTASCQNSEHSTKDATALDAISNDSQNTDGNLFPSDGISDQTIPDKIKVAAVQYAQGDFTHASSCQNDICGLSYFVTQAAQAGASIVVTPEYTMDQQSAEFSPEIGSYPVSDSRWDEGDIIKTFAKLAADQKITLIFNLITQEGEGTSEKLFNTSIAVDKTGKVVGRHYKFQLFGSESDDITAGSSVESSFFDTLAGKAGLMICADAQCIVTDLNPTADCSSHAIDMLQDFFGKKPEIVFFSSYWTVGPSNPIWWSVNIQQKIAKDGQVWLVAANTTQGDGKGAGIFKPGGEEVVSTDLSTPNIIYAELPTKK